MEKYTIENLPPLYNFIFEDLKEIDFNKEMFEALLKQIIKEKGYTDKKQITKLTIPNFCGYKGRIRKVTKIEKEVCKECNNIKIVIIPNTIEKIGKQAFFNCENIQKIVIPSSVKKIGKESFMDCKMLTNVNLYEGLKEIKAYAFANCPNLKNIIVPNSVTEIEDHAFEGIEHIEYHGIANDNGNHWGAKSIN